jgi:hypothetical protein
LDAPEHNQDKTLTQLRASAQNANARDKRERRKAPARWGYAGTIIVVVFGVLWIFGAVSRFSWWEEARSQTGRCAAVCIAGGRGPHVLVGLAIVALMGRIIMGPDGLDKTRLAQGTLVFVVLGSLILADWLT